MASKAKLSQKDYLKKYLSGGEGKKKKKKVKQTTSSTSVRTKIIDDDVDVSQMQPLDSSEVEIYDVAEDAPQVAGIIDERPAELRAREQYTNQKWKVLTDPLMGDIQAIEETQNSDKLPESKLKEKHEKPVNDDDKWGKLAKRLEEKREELSDEDSGKRKHHKHKKHKSKESSKSKKHSFIDEMHDKEVLLLSDEETNREREELRAKEEQHKKHLEKYHQWGKGVKQLEERRERLLEEQEEMEKPLARYADDEDLDRHLRDQEREGDPMLEYLRSKKTKEKSDAKPSYRGPYPPNRYNIRPGHRWDGVDRSCGYEKKWFETQNARRAVEEEAYKWSSSDL